MGDTHYSFGDVHGPVQTGAGHQNVVGGDQVIYREQRESLLNEMARVQDAVAQLQLATGARRDVVQALTAVEGALRSDNPDREQAGRSLEAVTVRLQEAGTLASAGSALIDALSRLAHWIGPMGHGVLALLGS